MSNIKKYLAQILSARFGKDVRQSIHDSIAEIDGVARTAQNSATASATYAQASATSAKSSETSARESATLAEQYKNDAFAGTPDGYADLVENVRLMNIKTTTDTTLADSKAGGLKIVSMSGNSVQNGEPTPDYPVAIQHTGDCVDIIPGYYGINDGKYSTHQTAVCSKNKIPCSSGDAIKVAYDTSVTTIAIVYYNDNGYLTSKHVSNTDMFEDIAPSGATYFNFYINKDVEGATVGKITLTINGKYVLQFKGHRKNFFSYDKDTTTLVKASVRYKTISTSKMVVLKAGTYNLIMSDLVVANNTNPLTARLLDNMGVAIASNIAMQKKDNIYIAKFTANSDSLLSSLYLFLDTNDNDNATATFSEIMIVKDDVTDYIFEEYKETVATVLLNAPLCDNDILYRTHVERHRYVVDLGAFTWNKMVNGRFETHSSTKLNFPSKKYANTEVPNLLCTHYIADSYSNTYSGLNDKRVGLYTDGKYIEVVNKAYSDATEFKNAMNGVMLEYELAEPIIEELDTASQIALNGIETFDTVTYITVDSRVQPSEIVSEYGTSIVGARTLKNELKNDTLEIKYNELAVALVATE